jgi:Zn ribbon nucleic-acid-binding protein
MKKNKPPDLVRLPVELGGQLTKVKGRFFSPCPQCKTTSEHLKLEGGRFVAECVYCGYVWYKKMV